MQKMKKKHTQTHLNEKSADRIVTKQARTGNSHKMTTSGAELLIYLQCDSKHTLFSNMCSALLILFI